MPIYEYECEQGHRFEEIQKFSDAHIESCECGAACKRLLSASSFALKGEGWSNDGYTKGAVENDFQRTAQKTKNQILREHYDYDAPT